MADNMVNNSAPVEGGNAVGGWVVALIVVIALIAGAFYWYNTGQPAQNGGVNVNVTVPEGTTQEAR